MQGVLGAVCESGAVGGAAGGVGGYVWGFMCGFVGVWEGMGLRRVCERVCVGAYGCRWGGSVYGCLEGQGEQCRQGLNFSQTLLTPNFCPSLIGNSASQLGANLFRHRKSL